jgi:phosphoribosylanthranilate isomerase
MSATTRGIIKICGLMEMEHAAVAARAGADLIGFVFAPSRRQITAERAATVIEELTRMTGGNRPKAVGVFLNSSATEMNQIAGKAKLDLIQVHGEPSDLSSLVPPYIRAYRTLPGSSPGELSAEIARAADRKNPPSLILIDGYHPQFEGGAGVPADWELIREVDAHIPVLVAGGLTAGNVREAIRITEPAGVDVSSGVETNGRKDSHLIRQFVEAARSGFLAQDSK